MTPPGGYDRGECKYVRQVTYFINWQHTALTRMELHVPIALTLLQSLKTVLQGLAVICGKDQSVEDAVISEEASQRHLPV